MSEREDALVLANAILDRPSGDPDDDLATLSRQLLRTLERAEKAETEAADFRNSNPFLLLIKYIQEIDRLRDAIHAADAWLDSVEAWQKDPTDPAAAQLLVMRTMETYREVRKKLEMP